MKEHKKGYRIVSKADRLFYFEKNFFTLDGLWMIELEAETSWEVALKIDLAVWKKLLRIVFRRIRKYLKLETNTLRDLIDILTFRWSVEGWDYGVLKNEEKKAIVYIFECPYKAVMERNPERTDKIALICKNMCIPFYEDIIKDFNPKITIDREKILGLGDDICDFHFKIE